MSDTRTPIPVPVEASTIRINGTHGRFCTVGRFIIMAADSAGPATLSTIEHHASGSVTLTLRATFLTFAEAHIDMEWYLDNEAVPVPVV